MANNNVLKATIWYALSNFILKGVGFLTTPIFTRILTKAEYGTYSNLLTWYSVVSIISSLSLSSSLVRARFDYKNDLNAFVKTNLLLGSFASFICSVIIILNKNFFGELFVLENKYLYIICLNTLTAPAYDIFLTVQRFKYKYKMVASISVAVPIANIFISLFLIHIWEDNLFARVVGTYLPTFIVSLIIYIYFLKQPGKIESEYCKYALVISVPYIFHLLSGTILNSSDKSVITRMAGPEDNALYSLAANIGMIVSVVWSSMNNAFSPWLGEQLNAKAYGVIKKYSYGYIMLFTAGVYGLMLLAPEALLLLGGESYYEARYCVPPIMVGYFFLFIYSMYGNVEQFEKKTIPMAVATCIAAAINVVTNVVFIKQFGYIAASYTTLGCYLILFIFHLVLVMRMGLSIIYDTRFIFLISVITCAVMVLCSSVLYNNNTLRLICVGIYIIAGGFVVWQKKDTIVGIVRKQSVL